MQCVWAYYLIAIRSPYLIWFNIELQMNISEWNKNVETYKLYEAMFRVIKESENVDERQHCFLVQTAGQESRYFSMETRQDLLRVESAWHRAVCQTVSQMGVSDESLLKSYMSSRL